LPDMLVVAFAPNRQSLQGAGEIATQAVALKREMAGGVTLPVIPLLSRVDEGEEVLRREWLEEAARVFSRLFEEVGQAPRVDCKSWLEMSGVPHRSYFAYGERIAAEEQKTNVSGSLAEGYSRLASVLVAGDLGVWQASRRLALSAEDVGQVEWSPKLHENRIALAREIVESYRTLAARNPDVFLPHLAASLNNLSNRLGEQGRREEGLAAVEEAVGAYRRLAEARPDAFLPDLAASLNNLSVHLGELGRREEGLAAVEEAVGIRRRLAEARPALFRADLARSLNNQARLLRELGRAEEAAKAAAETTALLKS